MAEVSEDRLDLLEEKIRLKVDTMSGFSDVEGKYRYLENVYKYFDTELVGRLDYSQFFAAMTRLNFVGVQRELESLFDRYDEDCSDFIDYKAFCHHLFGTGEHIALNSTSRSMVERFKAQIFERAGVTGLRGLRAHLESIDEDGYGLLERPEVVRGLTSFGIEADDGPGGDVEKIMGFFDVGASGHISIREFHRGMRGNMPKRRKLVVKKAFERLLDHCGGCVTVGDIRACYDPVNHPDVASGRIGPDDAFEDFLSCLCHANSTDQAEVFFCDFIDYFRDISPAIEDDEYFQEVAMNSWIFPVKGDRGNSEGGSDYGNGSSAGNDTTCRALVTHPDGCEEVLVIENARGIVPDDHKLMRKRLEEQGVQEIASVCLCE